MIRTLTLDSNLPTVGFMLTDSFTAHPVAQTVGRTLGDFKDSF